MNYKAAFYAKNNVSHPQPYVIIVGDLHSLTACYVVINEFFYRCKILLQAIDLCFKTFFAFDNEYSKACPHIWSFFHKVVYEIKGYKNIAFTNKMSQIITQLDTL